MHKKISLLLPLLFLIGCEEEFPTYTSFCTENKATFHCLNYAILDLDKKKRIKNSFGVPSAPGCQYRVELTTYHIGDCNNPTVKSVGSDFNGYVRVEIKKGFKCYYKVQSDYKNDANAAFQRVTEKIKNEYK